MADFWKFLRNVNKRLAPVFETPFGFFSDIATVANPVTGIAKCFNATVVFNGFTRLLFLFISV